MAIRYEAAVSSWWRLVWLSMGLQLHRYGRGSRLGFILSVLEPLAVITAMYVIRGLFRGKEAVYGTSLFLFIASGVLPYFLFLRLSTRTRGTETGPRSRLPGLSALDVYIATILVNALIWIFMIVAIFLGMWLYGIDQARPYSIATCAQPIVLLILFGMGVGMINNVITRYITAWNSIFAVLTRGLIFLSGVFFIVDIQPIRWRAWSILNPLSHGVEWFRLGVYGRYPHNSLDISYFVEWVLIALFIGLVVDRAALRTLDRN
ncbi:ABC transporter permease [Reyranella sp.]|uniref:ABC transporter permease n=1 Tax=Reyranella sp. TaxID=1929291 RepID=UPI003BACC051